MGIKQLTILRFKTARFSKKQRLKAEKCTACPQLSLSLGDKPTIGITPWMVCSRAMH